MKYSTITRKALLSSLSFGLVVLSQTALAEWLGSRTVDKLGTYQHATGHFVWLSGSVGGCKYADIYNSTLRFDESSLGGKSLMEVLKTAIVYRRTVDVQVNGCDIVEVYLR